MGGPTEHQDHKSSRNSDGSSNNVHDQSVSGNKANIKRKSGNKAHDKSKKGNSRYHKSDCRRSIN